ncbi:hypothetical protein TKK_0011641 [Trichogramma kaykai]
MACLDEYNSKANLKPAATAHKPDITNEPVGHSSMLLRIPSPLPFLVHSILTEPLEPIKCANLCLSFRHQVILIKLLALFEFVESPPHSAFQIPRRGASKNLHRCGRHSPANT